MESKEKVQPDKSRDKIESMFDEIAPAYDKLNHLFTLNIDVKWRKEIVKHISAGNYPCRNVLDLASGTGDLSKELLNLEPLEIIYAADISSVMLEIQRRKLNDKRLKLIQTEAQSMPFEDNYFDIVTIGFGVRNFENLEASMKEIRRVLKSGGKLVILEMFKSGGIRTGIFNLYFGQIMPVIGNKISKSNAYSYLFKSVNSFYQVTDFLKICRNCGFKTESVKNNFLGIVNTVYLNKK